MGLDAGDFGVERWAMVHEVDARRFGLVAERKTRVGRIGGCANRPAIEPHRQQDCGKKWDRDDRAARAGAGSGHSQSIAPGRFNSRKKD